MKKLFFILASAVMLTEVACSGAFFDPGMMDQPDGGGESGGKVYTVTFNINGGSGIAPSPIKARSGSSINLPDGSGFYRSGYTFKGWNTSSYGRGIVYKAGASYTVTGNVTLYADWEIPPTISYENNPIRLTSNTWYHGNITSASPGREAWFSFNVIAGNTYYVWWNDNLQGNETKSLSINVNAYIDSSSIFIDKYSSFIDPQSFIASSTGTVKLKVNPFIGGDIGTFDIAYSNNNIRPYVPCTVTYNINGGSGTAPPSRTVDYGSIITLPSSSGFSRSGHTFDGWNTNHSGDGTNYNAGEPYPVNKNVTLYAKWIFNAPGSESNPIPLIADTWKDGEITASTNKKEMWYSFAVTEGTTYYVWWNDHDDDEETETGDGTKTLDVKVSAYYNGEPLLEEEDNGWDTTYTPSRSFIASSTGTVKLKVYPYDGYSIGTFAVVFNTSSTRPGN